MNQKAMQNTPKSTIKTMLVLAVVGFLATKTLLASTGIAYAAEPLSDALHVAVLGDAVNYGVVTRTFMLAAGDAQTNVAAQEGTSKTQTGNDLTNPAEQPFILAHVPEAFNIKGFDAHVLTNAEDRHKIRALGGTALSIDTSYTADELAGMVEDMLQYASVQSEQLAAIPATAHIAYDAPSQKYVLDVREAGGGAHYVDVDAATYNAIAAEASKLRIYKNDDQVIVLNVRGDARQMHKFEVNGRGSDTFLGADAGAIPQTIIWNFANAHNIRIVGSVAGVILAPRADVTVDATSSGWLVAANTTIGSGEWHNVNQEVVERPQGPNDSPSPDPEPEPEPEPEPDPEPEPEPEPELPQTPGGGTLSPESTPSNPDMPNAPEANHPSSTPEAKPESSQPESNDSQQGGLTAESNGASEDSNNAEMFKSESASSRQAAQPTPSEALEIGQGLQSAPLAKTGDTTSFVGVLFIVALGVAAIAIARRM